MQSPQTTVVRMLSSREEMASLDDVDICEVSNNVQVESKQTLLVTDKSSIPVQNMAKRVYITLH